MASLFGPDGVEDPEVDDELERRRRLDGEVAGLGVS